MNDSNKLRRLADWIDGQQVLRDEWGNSTEVQDDLRRIADRIGSGIDTVYQENRSLEAAIKEQIKESQMWRGEASASNKLLSKANDCIEELETVNRTLHSAAGANLKRIEELERQNAAIDSEAEAHIGDPLMTLEAALDEIERLRKALGELVEVANLRGDNELPHPEDDPLLWNARMQDAWDEAARVIGGEDE